MSTQKIDITDEAPKVIEAEADYLKLKGDKTGIAISGGGIRSASFGLGVLQALVAKDQLKKMDYMSTVSGGGFLGSALTWALKQGGEDAGTKPENFPLGKIRAAERVKDEGNKLLDYIRQHGDYLTPTSSLGAVSFGAVILRSMLLSLFVYFTFLTVLLVVFLWSGPLDSSQWYTFYGWTFPYAFKGLFIPLGITLFGVYLLFSFGYSLRTFFKSGGGVLHKYTSFIRGQKIIGYLWKSSLVVLLLGSLPYINIILDTQLEKLMAASSSTVFGTIVGVWQYVKAQKNEKSSGIFSDLIIYLGAFALVYGLLLLAYLAAGAYFIPHEIYFWLKFLCLIASSTVLGIIVNLNLISPHRIWRDRLMEAYMPNKNAVKENQWEAATEADSALMEDMCDKNNPRPYHIINTNIILVDSQKTKYKNRGGDNFILSRLYSGSDATGWIKTKNFQKKEGRGMTLATAMATSAAALNPNAGVSGEGITRNSIVSILLAILNLRLGYWTTNPKAKRPLPLPPNFFVPGITSEISRTGLTENRTNIQLSDGGHFENLALYELIRRKLGLIILSDGGADPEFNFDDLANAIEKVRVDFGAKIEFKAKYGLDKILPGSNGNTLFDKKYNIAKHGFAVGDITYHDDSKGKLIYIKLAMIETLPTDVYSYKGTHSAFPHQSTADQFFDEKQFEAYRELGYGIGWQMMESPIGKKIFKSSTDA